jgi:superkiller protein 3
MLKYKQKKIKRLLKIAQSLSGDGNTVESIKILQDAIRIDPNCSEAYFDLGVAFDSLSKTELAIEQYKRCIELGDERPMAGALYNLGAIYLKLNRLSDSLNSFLDCIKFWPDFICTYLCLGGLYNKLHRYEDAIESYKKALEIDPAWDDPDTYLMMGSAYYKLAQYEEAISCWNKALQLTPEDSDLYQRLVAAYYNLKKYPEAITLGEKAVELNPKDWLTLSNLGIMYNKTDRPKDALERLKASVEIKPDHGYAQFNLGATYAMFEQWENAERHSLKAIEYDSTCVGAYHNLASICQKMGRGAEAEAYLARAKEAEIGNN